MRPFQIRSLGLASRLCKRSNIDGFWLVPGPLFRGRRSASFRLCFGRHQLSSLLPTGRAALAAVARAVAVAGGSQQTVIRTKERGLERTNTSFARIQFEKDNQSGDRNARFDS